MGEVIEMQCDSGAVAPGFDAACDAKQDPGLCHGVDELEWTACN
jgi:hypothetical protein